MEAIDFLRKKYSVPGNLQLSDVLKLPNYTWNDVCQLLEEFKDQIKQTILLEISKEYKENWNKMGSTGNYEWQKKLDELGKFGNEIYYFGRFRATEDIQDLLKKKIFVDK